MPPHNYWLNVAEKPSVAKEVANVLSRGTCTRGKSSSVYNPVFEFDFQSNGQSVKMCFTSVSGHLMEDVFPPHSKSWSSVPFAELFALPVTKIVKEEFSSLKKNLESLARFSNTLVLWLDCDREGENISFEVISVVRAVKPQITIKRAHFSSLSSQDLFRAVTNLQQPNEALSMAVDIRQELDLRVGAAFTRFQSKVFRDRFEHIPQVVSFGPCQFPTLGFVVQRFLEKESFVPEAFVCGLIQHTNITFSWDRGNIFDPLVGSVIFDEMLSRADGQPCVVSFVEHKPQRRGAPVPLATVMMQKLAASHLRLSSEECMTLAESLYQEGYISYPRTETDVFSFPDAELLNIARIHIDEGQVGQYAKRLVENPDLFYKRPYSGGHNDNAHPPIHPTKPFAAARADSSQPKAKLFDLVLRCFLACLSKDAIAASTNVSVIFGDEKFVASGRTVVEQNWLEVFPFERWIDTPVPNYKEGDSFFPISIELKEGITRAPPLLSEANLISTMDATGIGTDATIASHIKTIQTREYARMDHGCLIPTPLGLALFKAYDAIGFSQLLQPQLRSQMELAMSDVALGRAPKNDVLGAAVSMYRNIFVAVESKAEQLVSHVTSALGQPFRRTADAEPTTILQQAFSKCGVCSRAGQLLSNSRDSSYFFSCQSCNVRKKLPGGPTMQFSSQGSVCVLCNFEVVGVTNVAKQTTYNICPNCFTTPPIEASDHANGNFRCSDCTASCPLAGGSRPFGDCPQCGMKSLRLRSTKDQRGFSVSCKNFPQCSHSFFLPPAQTITISKNLCSNCQANRLHFSFTFVQQLPGLEREEELCVFCDARLTPFVRIKPSVPQLRAGVKAPTYRMPVRGGERSANVKRPRAAGQRRNS